MPVHVYPTTSEMSVAAAKFVSDRLVAAIRANGRATFGLAGGRTPRETYVLLVDSEDVDWTKVEFFFSDERAVPPSHPESNYLMACEELIDRLSVAPAAVHRMEAERADRSAAAHDYGLLLPESLDVLMLGIGTDGHTASIFPDDPAIFADALVVPVHGPNPPLARLTITPRVIAHAGCVIMLATGPAKAEPVCRALEGDFDLATTPAQAARNGHWFLDQEAADNLKGVG